jgi:hypothetical protein
LQTSSLILDFEFDQYLESHKHVINIIMGFRDMGCYRCDTSLPTASHLGHQLHFGSQLHSWWHIAINLLFLHLDNQILSVAPCYIKEACEGDLGCSAGFVANG